MERENIGVQTKDGLLLEVQVSPRAKHTQLLGIYDGALKIALQAPPAEGAANRALIGWISAWLGVSRQAVKIVGGHTSKRKRLCIEGMSLKALSARLEQEVSGR